MKTIYIVGLLILAISSAAALSMRSRWQKPSKPIGTNKMSFYDLTVNSIDGKEMHMSDFKGKYVLCVNVASKCGYTPQYEDLEKLYEQYQGKLVIVGFPCNQFANQEPGDEKSISEGCMINYGVTFPMFSKIDVNGENAHPIYKYLKNELGSVLGSKIKWNFTKFLISPDGNPFKRYSPTTKPGKIEKDILELMDHQN